MLLLGMVKCEMELNLKLLDSIEMKEFVRRVQSVRVPYDIGRLPSNLFDVFQTGMIGCYFEMLIPKTLI